MSFLTHARYFLKNMPKRSHSIFFGHFISVFFNPNTSANFLLSRLLILFYTTHYSYHCSLDFLHNCHHLSLKCDVSLPYKIDNSHNLINFYFHPQQTLFSPNELSTFSKFYSIQLLFLLFLPHHAHSPVAFNLSSIVIVNAFSVVTIITIA